MLPWFGPGTVGGRVPGYFYVHPQVPMVFPSWRGMQRNHCTFRPSSGLMEVMNIAIIGGGPAGLRAAEVAAAGGASVTIYDAKPSVGRKFLVAGRGGLNLTKTEERGQFASRYSGPEMPEGTWQGLLAEFDSEALRAWADGLGVETFVASTGRVYPKALKASVLLRRWVQRLRTMGAQFAMNHRWIGLERAPNGALRMEFENKGGSFLVEADRVILALGGGSWPGTGSDGTWTQLASKLGVAVAPLAPANCGWELSWPTAVLEVAEGKPLKNIVVKAGAQSALGELMVTRYGLEGGAIYQIGQALRTSPELTIDFKPTFSPEQLVAKAGKVTGNLFSIACQRWRLSEAAAVIIKYCAPPCDSISTLAGLVKEFRLKLTAPRPLGEAISSAGGICWSELDANLMLKKWTGVFVAGEMIDWEAPTGGYLLQGCFATGTRAAKSALAG